MIGPKINPRGKFRTRKTALLCDAGGDVFAPPSDPTAAEAPPPRAASSSASILAQRSPPMRLACPSNQAQSSTIKSNPQQLRAIKGNQECLACSSLGSLVIGLIKSNQGYSRVIKSASPAQAWAPWSSGCYSGRSSSPSEDRRPSRRHTSEDTLIVHIYAQPSAARG